LAIRLECRLELDDALRNMAVERLGEEDIFRHAFEDESRDVLETEALVVSGMSRETASAGTKMLQA